jgi:hypothetical protein
MSQDTLNKHLSIQERQPARKSVELSAETQAFYDLLEKTGIQDFMQLINAGESIGVTSTSAMDAMQTPEAQAKAKAQEEAKAGNGRLKNTKDAVVNKAKSFDPRKFTGGFNWAARYVSDRFGGDALYNTDFKLGIGKLSTVTNLGKIRDSIGLSSASQIQDVYKGFYDSVGLAGVGEMSEAQLSVELNKYIGSLIDSIKSAKGLVVGESAKKLAALGQMIGSPSSDLLLKNLRENNVPAGQQIAVRGILKNVMLERLKASKSLIESAKVASDVEKGFNETALLSFTDANTSMMKVENKRSAILASDSRNTVSNPIEVAQYGINWLMKHGISAGTFATKSTASAIRNIPVIGGVANLLDLPSIVSATGQAADQSMAFTQLTQYAKSRGMDAKTTALFLAKSMQTLAQSQSDIREAGQLDLKTVLTTKDGAKSAAKVLGSLLSRSFLGSVSMSTGGNTAVGDAATLSQALRGMATAESIDTGETFDLDAELNGFKEANQLFITDLIEQVTTAKGVKDIKWDRIKSTFGEKAMRDLKKIAAIVTTQKLQGFAIGGATAAGLSSLNLANENFNQVTGVRVSDLPGKAMGATGEYIFGSSAMAADMPVGADALKGTIPASTNTVVPTETPAPVARQESLIPDTAPEPQAGYEPEPPASAPEPIIDPAPTRSEPIISDAPKSVPQSATPDPAPVARFPEDDPEYKAAQPTPESVAQPVVPEKGKIGLNVDQAKQAPEAPKAQDTGKIGLKLNQDSAPTQPEATPTPFVDMTKGKLSGNPTETDSRLQPQTNTTEQTPSASELRAKMLVEQRRAALKAKQEAAAKVNPETAKPVAPTNTPQVEAKKAAPTTPAEQPTPPTAPKAPGTPTPSETPKTGTANAPEVQVKPVAEAKPLTAEQVELLTPVQRTEAIAKLELTKGNEHTGILGDNVVVQSGDKRIVVKNGDDITKLGIDEFQQQMVKNRFLEIQNSKADIKGGIGAGSMAEAIAIKNIQTGGRFRQTQIPNAEAMAYNLAQASGRMDNSTRSVYDSVKGGGTIDTTKVTDPNFLNATFKDPEGKPVSGKELLDSLNKLSPEKREAFGKMIASQYSRTIDAGTASSESKMVGKTTFNPLTAIASFVLSGGTSISLDLNTNTRAESTSVVVRDLLPGIDLKTPVSANQSITDALAQVKLLEADTKLTPQQRSELANYKAGLEKVQSSLKSDPAGAVDLLSTLTQRTDYSLKKNQDGTYTLQAPSLKTVNFEKATTINLKIDGQSVVVDKNTALGKAISEGRQLGAQEQQELLSMVNVSKAKVHIGDFDQSKSRFTELSLSDLKQVANDQIGVTLRDKNGVPMTESQSPKLDNSIYFTLRTTQLFLDNAKTDRAMDMMTSYLYSKNGGQIALKPEVEAELKMIGVSSSTIESFKRGEVNSGMITEVFSRVSIDSNKVEREAYEAAAKGMAGADGKAYNDKVLANSLTPEALAKAERVNKLYALAGIKVKVLSGNLDTKGLNRRVASVNEGFAVDQSAQQQSLDNLRSQPGYNVKTQESLSWFGIKILDKSSTDAKAPKSLLGVTGTLVKALTDVLPVNFVQTNKTTVTNRGIGEAVKVDQGGHLLDQNAVTGYAVMDQVLKGNPALSSRVGELMKGTMGVDGKLKGDGASYEQALNQAVLEMKSQGNTVVVEIDGQQVSIPKEKVPEFVKAYMQTGAVLDFSKNLKASTGMSVDALLQKDGTRSSEVPLDIDSRLRSSLSKLNADNAKMLNNLYIGSISDRPELKADKQLATSLDLSKALTGTEDGVLGKYQVKDGKTSIALLKPGTKIFYSPSQVEAVKSAGSGKVDIRVEWCNNKGFVEFVNGKSVVTITEYGEATGNVRTGKQVVATGTFVTENQSTHAKTPIPQFPKGEKPPEPEQPPAKPPEQPKAKPAVNNNETPVNAPANVAPPGTTPTTPPAGIAPTVPPSVNPVPVTPGGVEEAARIPIGTPGQTNAPVFNAPSATPGFTPQSPTLPIGTPVQVVSPVSNIPGSTAPGFAIGGVNPIGNATNIAPVIPSAPSFPNGAGGIFGGIPARAPIGIDPTVVAPPTGPLL